MIAILVVLTVATAYQAFSPIIVEDVLLLFAYALRTFMSGCLFASAALSQILSHTYK